MLLQEGNVAADQSNNLFSFCVSSPIDLILEKK